MSSIQFSWSHLPQGSHSAPVCLCTSSSNVTKHIQKTFGSISSSSVSPVTLGKDQGLVDTPDDALLVPATLVLFDGILSSETAADSESRALSFIST